MPQYIDVPGHGTVEFPDGMSEDEMGAAIKKNMLVPRMQNVIPDPRQIANLPKNNLPSFLDSYKEELNSRGFGDQYLAGAGGLFDQAAYGTKKLFTGLNPLEQQRVDAAGAAQKTFPGALGAATAGMATAPLYNAIPAAAAGLPTAARIGASVAGQGALGAGIGALTNPNDRAHGALYGGIGSAAGAGVAEGLGAAAASRRATLSADQQANALRDQAAAQARAAGYTIPPSQTNPSLLNRILEGISGKIQTGQHASQANERVTNKLAADALGIGQVSPASVENVRSQAGKVYGELAGQGHFTIDDALVNDMAKIGAKNAKAASVVNALKEPEVEALSHTFSGAGGAQLPSDAVVEAIKQLRYQASQNLNSAAKSGNPAAQSLGQSQREASKVMDDWVSRNLPEGSDLFKRYQDARTTIAKAHAVEDVMNETTGQVSAIKLGKQLKAGAPLSDKIKTIAQTAQAFPKAVQDLNGQSILPISPLDMAVAGSMGLGGAALGGATGGVSAGAAYPLLRLMARYGILSGPYQRSMGVPSYSTVLSPLATGAKAAAPAAGILSR